MNYKYQPKDANTAYVTNNLLLPKSRINVNVVKAALEFQSNEEEAIIDEETNEEIGSRLKVIKLWDETQHHLIVPREFIPASKYGGFRCEFVEVPPPEFERVRIDDHIMLRDEDQQESYTALLDNPNGTLNT